MVAAEGYIKEEVLNKGPRRISTSPETVHIQGIIEDSPVSESSLPAEEHTAYIQICEGQSP